ncbi:hypothetical protein DFH09DRAFT_1151623, partial [Mycena vulgaris]
RIGNLFNTLPITLIAVPPRKTPPRPGNSFSQRSFRQSACHAQATRMATKINDSTDLPLFRYIADADDSDLSNGRTCTLFHATRKSHLAAFQEVGVSPFPYSHANLFSPAPSFNLDDTVEQAVSHVLHARPTVRVNGAPVDPIIVFAFEVPFGIIFGQKTGYVDLGTPGEVLNHGDSAWISDNRQRGGQEGIEEIVHDFIVGPFLMPIKQPDGHDIYRIAKPWREGSDQPIHVAAVSRFAFQTLTENLKAIFVENEVSTTSELPQPTMQNDSSSSVVG